jgi:hypothetical protein
VANECRRVWQVASFDRPEDQLPETPGQIPLMLATHALDILPPKGYRSALSLT